MLTQAELKTSPLTQLSEEESLFLSSVRQFAEETIAPLVRKMDDEQQLVRRRVVSGNSVADGDDGHDRFVGRCERVRGLQADPEHPSHR